MRMLITAEVLDSLVGRAGDQELRSVMGPHLPTVMQSGKVTDGGFLTDRRGVFFIADVDRSEDLYEILGPEVYGYCHVEASPIASLEAGGQIFQQWAQQGR